jgi:cell division protein FtsI/penicillin-binding protein 2
MDPKQILHVVHEASVIHVLYMSYGDVIRINAETGEVLAVASLPSSEAINAVKGNPKKQAAVSKPFSI